MILGINLTGPNSFLALAAVVCRDTDSICDATLAGGFAGDIWETSPSLEDVAKSKPSRPSLRVAADSRTSRTSTISLPRKAQRCASGDEDPSRREVRREGERNASAKPSLFLAVCSAHKASLFWSRKKKTLEVSEKFLLLFSGSHLFHVTFVCATFISHARLLPPQAGQKGIKQSFLLSLCSLHLKSRELHRPPPLLAQRLPPAGALTCPAHSHSGV